jgi:long-chain acyl-CoA synthetase
VSSWFARYDPGVSKSVAPYPDKTLLDYLSDLARNHGNKPALLFKGASMSYRQLESQSDACAAAFVELGVMPGDRVALVLPNCPQFFIAEFGAWKAGATIVALNPTYTERELELALASSGASIAVTLTLLYQRVKSAQKGTAVRRVIATSIKEYLPLVLRVLFTLFKEKQGGHRISPADDDVWLQDLLRAHRSSPRPAVTVGPDDHAVVLSSGGTTGTPKGVLGLHRHYVAAGHQLCEWTRPALRPWIDPIMLPLPLFHVYGNVGVQPLALMAPAPLSLVPNPRDLDDLLKTIKQVKPAFFNGIPTLYAAILNHPEVRAGKVDLRSIRLCFSGASALMAETKRRFEEATGSQLVEGYSLTEAMMACCLNPVKGLNKIGSIGLPLPDVEVRIMDAEHGERDVPRGEVGELILRAPQIMAGYWNNPEETTTALRAHGEGGPWLHTGDLAYMDDEGYLFLVDRKKDMLKTSGFQVWPREIEEVLASHPAVMEVSVAGMPDDVKGDVPWAWIVPRTGHEASEEDLKTYCRERLAPYKVPARVSFRKDLPKTMVGKVLRRTLIEEAKNGLRP